jgi:O-antigen/teichoic acid export membrane protein
MTPRATEGPGTGSFVGERRAAARGVAWGGVESAASAVVGLVLTPLVVRACGLAGLGLWGASWSLAHTTNLLDLGVGASYTRFTSQAIAVSDVRRLGRLLSAGTGFHIILGVLVAGLALLVGPAALGGVAPAGSLAREARTVFACTLGTVLLRTLMSAYRGVVAGAQRIDLLGRIGAASSIVEGIGAASALAGGWSLPGMAINSLLVGACASLAEAVAAHRLVPGLRIVPFAAGPQEWRELLSFGFRLQVVRASEILAAHVPRLALAASAGLAPAGAYDLGGRVAGALQIAALPLPVIQPLAGRMSARGEPGRMRSLLERATRYVALLALPCAALVLLDAEAILRAWTGLDVPAAAASTARLLALALACGFVASPLRLVLRGSGRAGPEAIAALCGSLLHVALAVSLAPSLGAPGVAAAALAGSLLSAGILGIAARRAARGLGGVALRTLPTPLLAAGAGLLGATAIRLLVFGAGVSCATRGDALLRLLPEGALLAGVSLLVASVSGALVREDAAALASAFLPERARARADSAGVLRAGGRT